MLAATAIFVAAVFLTLRIVDFLFFRFTSGLHSHVLLVVVVLLAIAYVRLGKRRQR